MSNDSILKEAIINDGNSGSGGGSSSSSRSSNTSSNGETKSIKVIDAEKFVKNLKKIKKNLRCTYVESERGGAKIFRYVDYRSLMIALSKSLIEISVGDMGFTIQDVPAEVELEPMFEVEPYEIDIDDDTIPTPDED